MRRRPVCGFWVTINITCPGERVRWSIRHFESGVLVARCRKQGLSLYKPHLPLSHPLAGDLVNIDRCNELIAVADALAFDVSEPSAFDWSESMPPHSRVGVISVTPLGLASKAGFLRIESGKTLGGTIPEAEELPAGRLYMSSV